MGIVERKSRERVDRENRIIEAARAVAATEGWDAVTIRRLAEEIEYSQPVLYAHFENRDAIVAAVAVDGFRDLAAALGRVAEESSDRRDVLRQAAKVYLSFASEHPALYAAMFTMPSALRFAAAETKPDLKRAFAALSAIVATSDQDADVATETFWSVLHGLAELERSGRIRPSAREERVAFVVEAFFGG